MIFVVLARKEMFYDVPHWSGGRYTGWAVEGLPHKHGKIEMLLPNGKLHYEGEFNHGCLQGLGALAVMDVSNKLIYHYMGEFRDGQRYLGEQEWYTDGVPCKKFRGKWINEEPSEGVWFEYADIVQNASQ